MEFVPGADVCVKRRVNIKYCNPVYTCDFFTYDKSCVPCRAAGARAGAVCRRASARLATGTPGSALRPHTLSLRQHSAFDSHLGPSPDTWVIVGSLDTLAARGRHG